MGEVWRGRSGCRGHWATAAASVEALRSLETGEHGEGVGEVGGCGRGVGRSAHHLVVVVAVGDVGLLEKGAEGRLQKERLCLASRTLPNPMAALVPRVLWGFV